MIRVKKLNLLLLFFLLIQICVGQDYVKLSGVHLPDHLAQHSFIYEDKSSVLTVDDFINNQLIPVNDSVTFIDIQSEVPYMDFTTSTFWMVLKVENDELSFKQFNVELARALTNEVDLYVLNQDLEILSSYKSGDTREFKDRPIKYRKFIFPANFPPMSKRILLVRTKSDGEILKLPIKFWDRFTLTEFVSKENFFLGFYYGFIALVVILFAFFGVALRQKIYFYFVSYVFVMGLFQFSLDGFAYKYLWSSSPYLGSHSILIFAAISMLALLAYANKFLEFYKEKGWFMKTYKIFFGIVLVCTFTSMLEGVFYELTYPVLNGVSFLITTFFFIGIYLRYKSGHKPGIEITLAFAFLWVGAIFFILSNVNIIESDFLSANSLKLASGVEITFLSISLAARYRLTQNQKLEAEKNVVIQLEKMNQFKNEQTELLEKEVKLRTQEISDKSLILETQNKEIIQSITYAQRLQDAILPSDKLLEASFKESSIYFRPKDIVSGDFYWLEATNKYVFFAVADCTGHGVPGAMVSVVGHNSLNRCINEIKLTEPGKILDTLTTLVEHTFSKKDKAVSDGMDIALCRWDYKQELLYAGAFNNLYHFRNGDLTELPANRQPIGKFIKREPFITQKIDIEQGDSICLFTDGYMDQFGGEKGKKLKAVNFKKILFAAIELPINEFSPFLNRNFDEWKNKEEQIDDICIMRINF